LPASSLYTATCREALGGGGDGWRYRCGGEGVQGCRRLLSAAACVMPRTCCMSTDTSTSWCGTTTRTRTCLCVKQGSAPGTFQVQLGEPRLECNQGCILFDAQTGFLHQDHLNRLILFPWSLPTLIVNNLEDTCVLVSTHIASGSLGN
jgi:hypothetical protein